MAQIQGGGGAGGPSDPTPSHIQMTSEMLHRFYWSIGIV